MLAVSFLVLSISCLLLLVSLLRLPERNFLRLLIIPLVVGWGWGAYRLLVPFFVSRRFEADFAQGRSGEEAVSQLLSGLPSGFHVFHDLHFGKGGNIDFVVTGPCGIVAVEVKNYRIQAEARGGRLLLAGREVRGRQVQQALNSALLLKDFLESKVTDKVYVSGVLAFVSELVLQGKYERVGSVLVVKSSELPGVLQDFHGSIKMEKKESIDRVLALIARKQII